MQTNLLDGLNDSQKEGVLHTEGPLLLLAGAGSGKTRVITHRIAHLILNQNVPPYKICALTFTNKAAAEMQERVRNILPNLGHMVMIKTFHSLCLFIIRRFYEQIHLKSGFSVYDTSLSETLLKEVIKDLSLDNKAFKPKNINSIIQSAKDKMISPGDFLDENGKDSFYKAVAKIYEIYELRKTERNALDFGDLIFKTVELFKNTDIKNYYNNLWEYIMIDEYQDTNRSQYFLSLQLAGLKKNICVVGDDDQSIYSWRGADIRNILDFEKDYKYTKIIKLEENYRSTSNIIKAAGAVIQNNTGRKSKNLFTQNKTGNPILLTSCSSEMDESKYVIKKIKDFYKKEKTYLKSAIFYRTNAQSRFFEDALRMENIPYKIYGGFRFYDRAEIKDLIAYLTFIVNPADTGSLLRIINFPPRGVGETTIEKLRVQSLERGVPMFEVLGLENGLRKQTKKNIDFFLDVTRDLMQMHRDGRIPSEIARSIVVRFGIDEEYKKGDDLESIDRLENIAQFIESIQEYEETAENPSLEEYLTFISLLTSEESASELQDYVTLMTVHNSKGLEFHRVFLTGMEEGTFPHFMSMDSGMGLEEERRLCYVAITRAREELYISYSKHTRKFGDVQERIPSRFLNEIPDELFSTSNETFYRMPVEAPRAGNNTQKGTGDKAISGNTIQVGQRVRHREYGVGKILEISGSGDNKKAKIQFGYSEKNFLLAYTQLEPIS